jgi:hypothetical protein
MQKYSLKNYKDHSGNLPLLLYYKGINKFYLDFIDPMHIKKLPLE